MTPVTSVPSPTVPMLAPVAMSHSVTPFSPVTASVVPSGLMLRLGKNDHPSGRGVHAEKERSNVRDLKSQIVATPAQSIEARILPSRLKSSMLTSPVETVVGPTAIASLLPTGSSSFALRSSIPARRPIAISFPSGLNRPGYQWALGVP